jgi:hypothetical protein
VSGYGLAQVDRLGSCTPTERVTPVLVTTAPSAVSTLVPLTLPSTPGSVYYIVSYNDAASSLCSQTQIVVYDQIVDVSPALFPLFPVSVLAYPGQYVALKSNAAMENLVATRLGAAQSGVELSKWL